MEVYFFYSAPFGIHTSTLIGFYGGWGFSYCCLPCLLLLILHFTLPQHICQTIFTPQRTFFQRHLWLSFPMSLVPPHGWLQRLFSVRCTSGCEEVTRFMQSGKGTIATPLLAGPRWNKKTQTYYQCPFKRFLLQAHVQKSRVNGSHDGCNRDKDFKTYSLYT